jgi:ATP-grasp domain
MRILLSDGTGLTSRQTATLLSRAGHTVEALSPDPLCLCRFTRHVRRVHRVPAYGQDPFGWLDAALAIAAQRGTDLLFPTQEQVAVLSQAQRLVRGAGIRTAVPDFASLAQVQDKVSAYRTLSRLGLPQPAATVAGSAAELQAIGPVPVFVKTAIGTASTGVSLATSAGQLRQLAASREAAGAFTAGGVLAQQPVSGPLVMIQSVFARGELLAFHAAQRVREGAGGGASHKRGIDLPVAREHMTALGGALGWHGALSADVILTGAGPQFIDINPRLVEPMNASQSGVDLVGALLDAAAADGTSARQPWDSTRCGNGQPGALTHQLLLAVLGAAQHSGRRRVIAAELLAAISRRGSYRASTEELTPVARDPLAATPVAIAALATLIRPGTWRRFVAGSVDAYSLTPAAWGQIIQRAFPGRPDRSPGLRLALPATCRR